MLKQLLLFARSKPAEESYNFIQPGSCAIAQFLRDTGAAAEPNVGVATWSDDAIEDAPNHDIDPRISNWSQTSPVGVQPWTWGALAQRLEFEDFLDFARGKPADETYDYVDNRNCAFAQYLKSIGVDNPSVVPGQWKRRFTTTRYDYDPRIDPAAADIDNGHDWTWGALVKRLEAAA